MKQDMCWSAELIFRFSSHFFPPFFFVGRGGIAFWGLRRAEVWKDHFFSPAKNLIVHTLYSFFLFFFFLE